MLKWMVTIVWNPNGFHLIHILPSGGKFNRCYHRREIFESLSEGRREQAGGADRKLIVHAENARHHRHTVAASHHFMQENGPERAIHPPHSPDLAPSDFLLFSHVKHCLRGQSSEMADELVLVIDAVLRGSEKWALRAAFLDWMQRLRPCVEANGHHLEGVQKSFAGGIRFTR
jgi:hypothetical protein